MRPRHIERIKATGQLIAFPDMTSVTRDCGIANA
jgi:hypothetical protein